MKADDSAILVFVVPESYARLYAAWLQESGFAVEAATDLGGSPTMATGEFDAVVANRNRGIDDFPETFADASLVLTGDLDDVLDLVDVEFEAFVAEPVSRSALVDAIQRVRRREGYGPGFVAFARTVEKVALVRSATTVEQRRNSDIYGGLVDRFLARYTDAVETIATLESPELNTLLCDEEQVRLVIEPTETLDVRQDWDRPDYAPSTADGGDR